MEEDSEPAISEEESQQLLREALHHLDVAKNFMAARTLEGHGTANEQAALYIALAQAEGVLSIAGQLSGGGDGLGKRARQAIDGLTTAASELNGLVRKFRSM